jgi:galactokinase
VRADALESSLEMFGPGETCVVSAPGRVNLIGEHIDYHGLAVLPMALRRRIRVAFRPRADNRIRAVSAGYGMREFDWTPDLSPAPAGDWENYLRAAAQAVARKWGAGVGVDAAVISDLPAAAGLASSSALMVAFTLALLGANRRRATFEELMEALPEGEQFVGTRGGGMDHAASLASREGCASLIEFDPIGLRAIRVPEDWGFLVAHCLKMAEKSGAAREAYNARRAAGAAALARLGAASFRALLGGGGSVGGCWQADAPAPQGCPLVASLVGQTLSSVNLTSDERNAFEHVTSEARRVSAAASAMERADAALFGRLLLESHASLRDVLQVSCPELDRLVDAAMQSGALGARLTGAGFGGCAMVFAAKRDMPAVRQGLAARFYSKTPVVDPDTQMIDAEPGPGALHMEMP